MSLCLEYDPAVSESQFLTVANEFGYQKTEHTDADETDYPMGNKREKYFWVFVNPESELIRFKVYGV